MAVSETHCCVDVARDDIDEAGSDEAFTEMGEVSADSSFNDALRLEPDTWTVKAQSEVAMSTPSSPGKTTITSQTALNGPRKRKDSEDALAQDKNSLDLKSEAKRRAPSVSPPKTKRSKTENDSDSGDDATTVESAPQSTQDAEHKISETANGDTNGETSQGQYAPFEADVCQVIIVEVGARLHEDIDFLTRYGERLVSGLRRTYVTPQFLLSRKCPGLAAKVEETAGVDLKFGAEGAIFAKPEPESATPKDKCGIRDLDRPTPTPAVRVLSLPNVLPQVFAALLRWLYAGEARPEQPMANWYAYHGSVEAVDVAMGICELGRDYAIPHFHNAGIHMIEEYYSVKKFDPREFVHSAVRRWGIGAPLCKYLLALCAFDALQNEDPQPTLLEFRGDVEMATAYHKLLFPMFKAKLNAASKTGGAKGRPKKTTGGEKRFECPHGRDYYL